MTGVKTKSLIIACVALLASATAALAATESHWDVRLTVGPWIGAGVRWAIPEHRVYAPGTNWDATFFLSIASADDNDHSIFFTTPLASSSVAGDFLLTIPVNDIPPGIVTGMTTGTYDVIIKTHQHLAQKLDNIFLHLDKNWFNFTDPMNGVLMGDRVLLGGDINLVGNNTSTLGDNVINSVDLSLMLNVLDDDDAITRHELRANLNQDIVINSVDMSILLKNLDMEGDR